MIVQNQYPTHRLGEVSGRAAVLPLHRGHGGAGGVRHHPQQPVRLFARRQSSRRSSKDWRPIRPPPASSTILRCYSRPGAKTGLLELFGQFGANSQKLFDSFMGAVRHSLEFAISDVFFWPLSSGVAGFVVVLFLKEVPLGRTHSETLEEAAEAALAEIGAEEEALSRRRPRRRRIPRPASRAARKSRESSAAGP